MIRPINGLFQAHLRSSRFDAVKPLILTDLEKSILREYFIRGGFILFEEDAFPYSQDEFWSVKEWPVIDLSDHIVPDISCRKKWITDAHALCIKFTTWTNLRQAWPSRIAN